MEVTLAVAAREIKTHGDGTLDIFGVFDEMTTPELPCVVEQMIVVVSLSGDAAEVGLRACANRLKTFRTWLLSERSGRLFSVYWHIRYSPIGAAS